MLHALWLAILPMVVPQTEVVPPPAPAEQEAIVVTARKMRDIRVLVKRDRKTGKPGCRIRKSSGDSAFDAEFCNRMVACYNATSAAPPIVAATRQGADRRTLVAIWEAESTRCMAPFFDRLETA